MAKLLKHPLFIVLVGIIIGISHGLTRYSKPWWDRYETWHTTNHPYQTSGRILGPFFHRPLKWGHLLPHPIPLPWDDPGYDFDLGPFTPNLGGGGGQVPDTDEVVPGSPIPGQVTKPWLWGGGWLGGRSLRPNIRPFQTRPYWPYLHPDEEPAYCYPPYGVMEGGRCVRLSRM